MPTFTQIASVAGLLAALVYIAWVLGGKKSVLPFRLPAGANRQRRMTVVERLPLVSQHILHLVEVDGKPVLILTSNATAQIVPDPRNVLQSQRAMLPPDGARQ